MQVDFDLQKYLDGMEARLGNLIDKGFNAQEQRSAKIAADLANHETADATFQTTVTRQLDGVDEIRKSFRWFVRIAGGGLLVYAVKVIFLTPHP